MNHGGKCTGTVFAKEDLEVPNIVTKMGDEEGGAISYADATRANIPRILFTGPRRSGKSSIESGMFHLF